MSAMENDGIDNGWRENNEKTEKKHIGCLGEINITRKADEQDEEEKSAQEEEEGVSEFEEEVKKRALCKQPQRVFDKQAGENERKKTDHKRCE